VEISLGPEMKSTGEVMGRDQTLEKALYKGLIASGMKIPNHGTVLFTIADEWKKEALALARRFHAIGYTITATQGTAAWLNKEGIPASSVAKVEEESPNILDFIREGKAQFVINTMEKQKKAAADGFRIRREAVENEVVCLTSLDTAGALLKVLEMITFSTEAMPAMKEDRTNEVMA
jgi:carbamoyl-phosphate synthase large subunit